MLILCKENIKKIAEENLSEITDAVEQAVIRAEKNDFLMPERMHISQGDNTHLVMPVYSNKRFSTKLVSVFPGNAKNNIPVINGMMSLNSSETGEPLALLNGASVTGYRTGAVGAVGVRHLADENVVSLGIVGAGVQGYHQILAASKEREFKRILIFDIDSAKADDLKQKLKFVLHDFVIDVLDDIDVFTKQCDVIITATTSKTPVLPANKTLLFGKTIISIGSFKPDMKEIPNEIFKNIDKCFVDTKTALSESGDMIEPIVNSIFHIDNIFTLGSYILNKESVKLKNTRFFKSVGMALFDLYVADKIYEIAIRDNIGVNYEL
ncbi:MAG: ornithine cyclodeaminase family protein [Bacteroidota bacterium]|nr:ornithine cyclodeaminase family protein [Bacteroidota bacterium]